MSAVMVFFVIILLPATLNTCANALNITSPPEGTTEVPVWPETLFEWTWGPQDPAAIDIILQYEYPNTSTVHNFTWKSNFPAEQRSVTIPWIPLGLDIGTVCELGLVHANNSDEVYDSTYQFTLVGANGNAPSASNYPPTIYTTTSASHTYILTSTIPPIQTGLSTSSVDTTISATTSRTVTSTFTETSDFGTSTVSMSALSAAATTTGPSALTAGPVAASSSSATSVVTVHRTTTTQETIFETGQMTTATSAISTLPSSVVASAAPSSSAAATSSLDISFSTTPYYINASTEGPVTVYITTTETVPCSAEVSELSTEIMPTAVADTAVTNTTCTDASIVTPPFAGNSSTAATAANTTSASILAMTTTMSIPFSAPISMQTQTGGVSSIYDSISVQNATGLYMAGLCVLAYVAFMLGLGI